MKTFDQLNETQQALAIEKCLVDILTDIVEGRIRFDDPLQDRIDAAMDEAERMQTPWFAADYVIKAIDAELSGMALADATHALYPERGERIVEGVAV